MNIESFLETFTRRYSELTGGPNTEAFASVPYERNFEHIFERTV